MRFLCPILLLSLLWVAALAVHESDVGVIDWHTKLIGVPLYTALNTAPVFHDDLVLTATSSNVLAALTASDGSIVWRSVYDHEDPILAFKVHSSKIATLSGPGGSTFRSYDISTGHLLAERRLHDPANGRKHELQDIVISSEAKSARIVTLTNGDTVSCIDLESGQVLWAWNSPDKGSLIIYSDILTSPAAIYAVGLARAEASYTLHVTTLSASTGSVIASVNVPSKIANGPHDFVLLSAPANTSSEDAVRGPCLAWLESSTLKAAMLSPGLEGQVHVLPGTRYTHLLDIGLKSSGQLVAFAEGSAAHVIKYDGESLRPIWEYSDVAPSPQHGESYFAGSLDKDGKPRIARVHWSNVHGQAIYQTLAVNLEEGKGTVSGYMIPFETHEFGVIRHVAIDGPSSGAHETTRLLLTTSTGTIQLWQQDVLEWSREEALSAVRVAAFVPLPRPGIVFPTGLVATDNMVDALFWHLRRFYRSTIQYFSTWDPTSVVSGGSRLLQGDAFGLRQVIIVATEGTIYGLDSSNGRVIWRRLLGLGWAGEGVGARVVPIKLFTISKKVESGAMEERHSISRNQTALLVAQRIANNGLVDTVIFEVDPFTGADARSPEGDAQKSRVTWQPLEGRDIIQGPMTDAFLLPDESGTVAVLDEFLQVQLYPDTLDTRASLGRLASSLHLVLSARTSAENHRAPQHVQLVGHRITFNEGLSLVHVAYPTWRVSLMPDETIRAMIPNANTGPIASLGRTLGDRRTLYKYLNPHMRVVTTETSAKTCGIYLLDSVKGTVLYHVSVPAADGRCDVRAALVDNWLVYSYFDDDAATGERSTKGWRLVSVEMYEGSSPDKMTRRQVTHSELSAYSNVTTDVTMYAQTWLVPQGITALAPTSTRFGVTVKDLIVASRKHNVHYVPRRLLDPRRPIGKPSPAEAEEGLVTYDPVLPSDARLVLSHSYEVADVRQIIAAPTRLESTSLVLAIGLDLFLTRVTPSGSFDVLSENFNKVQLVLIVTGLAVAILVARPIVRRRRLRERWYPN